jgi:GDP-L-fucose synthase
VEHNVKSIDLWGTGEPTRDFLYVEDAAEAVIAAAEHYNGAEPVNIGSGQEISIRQVAERIADLVGFSGAMQWDAAHPNGQQRRCVDVTRARQAFGFQARTPLDAGLRATVDWYVKSRSAATIGCSTQTAPREG